MAGKEITLFGKKYPRWGVIAIGVGGAGAVYFAIRQKQKANAAASGSAALGAIDPITGLPTSEDQQIDPITGQTYLSEAQQYGSVAAADSAFGAADQSAIASGSGSGGSFGSSDPFSGFGNNGTSVGPATYATNAQWAQAVTSGLAELGYSTTDVTSALGLYLGGLPETSAQANIVQVALAEFGAPPAGSFQIILAPPTGGTTVTPPPSGGGDTTPPPSGGGGTTTPPPSGGGGTTTTPPPSGGGTTVTKPPVVTNSTVSGGHVVSVNNNDAVIAWSHSGPATSWRVTITGPGAINGHTATVGIPQATYSGLSAGHTYEVAVQPLPTGSPGEITFVTT